MNEKQNSLNISVEENFGVRENSPTMKIYDGFLYESIQFFMKENYSISIVFSWTPCRNQSPTNHWAII